MSFQAPGALASDEQTCRYGASRLRFRAPKRSLRTPFVACVGGTETFGRFVDRPFPVLLEDRIGRSCINFGSVGSGIDTFLNDPDLLRIASMAEICILQVPGAQNLSNRMYRVHPRRNDRFVQASAGLCRLFPEVDFTEFHYTKHMLSCLNELSRDRFAEVVDELRTAWIARMGLLIQALGSRVLLLWLRYEGAGQPDEWAEPLMVSDEMVEAISGAAIGVAEIPVSSAARTGEVEAMTYGTLQEQAAGNMIGPATHMSVADQVQKTMDGM